MPPGEQITFEPALAGMLGENFHHPAVRGEMIIFGDCFRQPCSSCGLEQSVEPVRCSLVGTDDAEVARR